MILYVLAFLWLFRQVKYVLFWLYFWQLKEYHWGRFLAHFSTEKGKNLLLNRMFFLKVFLLSLCLFFNKQIALNSFLLVGLLVLYFVESGKFFLDIARKRIKSPVWTLKTVFLLIITLVLHIIYPAIIYQRRTVFLTGILIFDILTPLVASGVVFLFQPLAVLWKHRIISRAKKKRNRFEDLKVVGITGSYGKSSTKEFLSTILSEKFKVLKTEKNQNSEVGISSAIIDNLDSSHQVFVVEMGAYNKGGIKLLSDIARPQVGILTGINQQHLATFGSQQNIIDGKYELIEALPSDGTAIFNGENRYCRDLYKKTEHPQNKKICFASREKKDFSADFWINKVDVKKRHITFEASSFQGKSVFLQVNLIGRQNLENVLLAVCAARELGMSLEEIAEACKKINPSQRMMNLFEGWRGVKIIKSTYSANPTGVQAHLDYLRLWEDRKKIVILPCLIELGNKSQEIHEEIGKEIGKVCDLVLLTTKECFPFIHKGAVKTGLKEENILMISDPLEAVKKLKKEITGNEVILLEGRVPEKIINFLMSS